MSLRIWGNRNMVPAPVCCCGLRGSNRDVAINTFIRIDILNRACRKQECGRLRILKRVMANKPSPFVMAWTFNQPSAHAGGPGQKCGSRAAVIYQFFGLLSTYLYMGISPITRSVGCVALTGARRQQGTSCSFSSSGRRVRSAPSSNSNFKNIRLFYLLAGLPHGTVTQGPMCPVVAQAATMEAQTSNPLLTVRGDESSETRSGQRWLSCLLLGVVQHCGCTSNQLCTVMNQMGRARASMQNISTASLLLPIATYIACVADNVGGWTQDADLPLFDRLKAEDVVPGISTLITELNEDLTSLEKTVQPTWPALVEPIERITDRLSRAWGSVSHLKVRPVCQI
jgi:hypothetical protein